MTWREPSAFEVQGQSKDHVSRFSCAALNDHSIDSYDPITSMTIDGVSNSKLKKRDLKYIVAQKA